MAVTTHEATAGAPSSLRQVAASPMAPFHLVAFAVACLSLIGGLMVLSASSVLAQSKGESPYFYTLRQGIFLIVGVVALLAISRVRPDTIRRLGWLGWGLSVVALALVLSPLGHHVNGNTNWINIGPVTFQPSEFAKLGMVVWAGSVYHAKRGRLHETWQLLIPFVPGGLVLLALVLAGKDLGTGMVFGLVFLALLFFVGMPLRFLLLLGLGAAGLVTFLVLGSENRMRRFALFFDPAANPDAASQPMAALYALASGGWWGLGLGASKQKWGGLKDGAHTDYIFAVIGEELGLFGVLVVIGMFAVLAWAGFTIALRSDKIFNRLVSAGITAWFCIQAVINMMVVLHLLPVLGVPLPFVSYGGSALMANLMAAGVLLSCARDTPDVRRSRAARQPRPRMTSVLAAGGKR